MITKKSNQLDEFFTLNFKNVKHEYVVNYLLVI